MSCIAPQIAHAIQHSGSCRRHWRPYPKRHSNRGLRSKKMAMPLWESKRHAGYLTALTPNLSVHFHQACIELHDSAGRQGERLPAPGRC